MKALIQQQALRINALTLRERAILFLSLMAALAAAADALVLSPRMAEQKQLAQSLRQQASELVALRARLSGAAASADTPQSRKTRELQAARHQLQQTNAEIERLLAAGAGTRLSEVLERLLKRQDRLTLQKLAAAPASPATAATAASPGGALPSRSVELVLRGGYHDLMRYVAEAEAALPGLRWAELTLTQQGDSNEMRALVVLLGENP